MYLPYRVQSAQRLQASKVKAHSTQSQQSVRHTSSAQRLQASKVKALIIGVAAVAFDFKCSTPTGIKGKGTAEEEDGVNFFVTVLNAYRHQR